MAHIVKITATLNLDPGVTEGEPITDKQEAIQSLIENACDDCCDFEFQWSDGRVEAS
jgi:hypothetical protein